MITPRPIKQGFTIILLVLSYMVGTMGLFTSYYTYYHRQVFQSEIRRAPASHLTKLTFTEREFKSIEWIDDREEFQWQGRMYDVSSISKGEGGFVILCKNDTMEEILLSLVNLAKDDHQQGVRKGIPQPQFFNQTSDTGHTHVLKVEALPSSLWCSFYLSVTPQTSSPPPRG